MKRKIGILLLAALAFVLALGLTLYPVIAAKYNAAHQSSVHADYNQLLQQQSDDERQNWLVQAHRYNAAIAPGASGAFSQDQLTQAARDYAQQLDITGTGLMGYVVIPAIDVNLPIYHGTADAVLSQGVGHLLGSSLPVGGEGTHAVLTGHSGMAGQKMFSDLPNLQIGDVFYLEVLGQRIAYRVEEKNVVLPYDTEKLCIEQDRDLCTLVTCTPYGINSHRLLVRGSRTELESESIAETLPQEVQHRESTWEQQYQKGIAIGAALAGVLSLPAAVFAVWRRKRG